MSNKAKKAAAEVARPKAKTGSKKSWRRLMWDAVSIYDVEAVSFSTELSSFEKMEESQGFLRLQEKVFITVFIDRLRRCSSRRRS